MWRIAPGAAFPFASRAGSGGTARAHFVDAGALQSELEERVRRHGLLDADFGLDFGGGRAELGPVVRARTELAGGLVGFAVRHARPESFVAAAEDRADLLRTGLLVAALFCAGAGLAIARALRRERALGELKLAFVAGVSHELRTPLSSILLMAENLESGRVRDAEACARYHRLIRREAGRLHRLVDDVLDFARLDRGEEPRLRVEPLALGPFARELEAEVRDRVEHRDGRLDFACGALPEEARLDGAALRRAVLNLVDNALEHGGPGDGPGDGTGDGRGDAPGAVPDAIEVRLDAEPPGTLRIRVRDRGPGIPDRRREEVFRPFARLGEGVNGRTSGSGLGLAIVRQIAAAHGGTARARAPAEGPGVVFELALPLAVEDRGEP